MPEEIKIEVSEDGKRLSATGISGCAKVYLSDSGSFGRQQFLAMLPYLTRWANGAPDFREPPVRTPRPWTWTDEPCHGWEEPQ